MSDHRRDHRRVHHRTAAIVSSGDELVLGQSLDTNSRWLARQLTDHGILPTEHVTVPDDAASLTATLLRLAAANDLILVSGGLGPTPDDLTRQALADATGQPLIEDAEALRALQQWFDGQSRPMPAANRVQAMRPRDAACLPNPFGTAPGLSAKVGNSDVFCLPGPPRELQPMFEAQVAPRLRPQPGQTVVLLALPTFGLGESDVASRLGPLMDRGRNPVVGTTASGGVVTCRIRYAGPLSAPAAAAAVDAVAAQIESLLGPFLLGRGERSLQEFVVAAMRERGRTVAVVESCTGGLAGTMLTDVPGSSSVFLGGWLTYSNDMKRRLGVPDAVLAPGGPGAVSRECAEAMAAAGLAASAATDCVAITGIAGPLGEGEAANPQEPVGTVWICHAERSGVRDTRRFLFSGERANIRDWAARSALAMLRLGVIGHSSTPLMRQLAD